MLKININNKGIIAEKNLNLYLWNSNIEPKNNNFKSIYQENHLNLLNLKSKLNLKNNHILPNLPFYKLRNNQEKKKQVKKEKIFFNNKDDFIKYIKNKNKNVNNTIKTNENIKDSMILNSKLLKKNTSKNNFMIFNPKDKHKSNSFIIKNKYNKGHLHQNELKKNLNTNDNRILTINLIKSKKSINKSISSIKNTNIIENNFNITFGKKFN